MSFTITTDVFCDAEGCGDWVAGVSKTTIQKTKAWKRAEYCGWTKVDGKHLCPLCNGRASYKLPDGSYVWNKKDSQ